MEPSPELTAARAAWTNALRARDSISAEHFRELEAHLDDTMADLRTRGLTAEEAFLIGTRRLGAPVALAAEFEKAGNRSLHRYRGRWMLLGVVVYVGTVAAARVLLDIGALAWALGMNDWVAGLWPIVSYVAAAAAGVWVLRGVLNGRLPRWARGMVKQAPLRATLLCIVAAFLLPALSRLFVTVAAARLVGTERVGYVIRGLSVTHLVSSALCFVVLLVLLYRYWRPKPGLAAVAS